MAVNKGLGHRQFLRQTNTIRIDPRVILASQLLEMNQVELGQALETELSENPALERIDAQDAAPTIEEILSAIAPCELTPGGGCNELHRSLPRDSGVETDWVDFTPSNDSLWDRLSAQLLGAIDHKLCEYLVGSINERGYLTCNREEIALACSVSLEEAEEAIALLKTCEPAGIGAHDLRECLELQLRDAATPAERLARKILRDDFEALVKKDARPLRRKYKVPIDLVEEAFFVVSSLNPFPGEDFRVETSSVQERSCAAQADLVIKRDEQGWVVEVQGPSVLNLRVDRGYEARNRELLRDRSANRDEKRHITEYVDRANRFLDAVSQRRRLLANIGRYLVGRQSGFVATGDYQFLIPLTRSQMAADLGAHESTVSRATSGKFIQIATGEVVSFDIFFKPALRIQKMIEDILTTENPDNPLSDESISRILESQGIKVARRTVNKYRDKNKLLSSRRRRSA